MKMVGEYSTGRTNLVFGALIACACASPPAYCQEAGCSNGCGAYADYALAQRLNFPPSFQNMSHAEIEKWFSRHPKYSSKLKMLANECERSCTKCGDWSCPSP